MSRRPVPTEDFDTRYWDALIKAIAAEFSVDVGVLRLAGAGTWPARLFGAFGQTAVTLNGRIHLCQKWWDIIDGNGQWIRYRRDERLYYAFVTIGHETYHVIDQQQTGWWRWLWRYIKAWRPSHIRNGKAHPMEAPAYAFEKKLRALMPYPMA